MARARRRRDRDSSDASLDSDSDDLPRTTATSLDDLEKYRAALRARRVRTQEPRPALRRGHGQRPGRVVGELRNVRATFSAPARDHRILPQSRDASPRAQSGASPKMLARDAATPSGPPARPRSVCRGSRARADPTCSTCPRRRTTRRRTSTRRCDDETPTSARVRTRRVEWDVVVAFVAMDDDDREARLNGAARPARIERARARREFHGFEATMSSTLARVWTRRRPRVDVNRSSVSGVDGSIARWSSGRRLHLFIARKSAEGRIVGRRRRLSKVALRRRLSRRRLERHLERDDPQPAGGDARAGTRSDAGSRSAGDRHGAAAGGGRR